MKRFMKETAVCVKAYSSTTGVLPAFSIEPKKHKSSISFVISIKIASKGLAGGFQ